MTNSSLISKIEKAHRYAQEPDRVQISEFKATFRGGHANYDVSLTANHWACTCHTFESHALGTCSHIMALQEIMEQMLSSESRYSLEQVAAIAE